MLELGHTLMKHISSYNNINCSVKSDPRSSHSFFFYSELGCDVSVILEKVGFTIKRFWLFF